MQRRRFLKSLLSIPVVASTSTACASALKSPGADRRRAQVLAHPLFQKNQTPILQGVTTETSTQLIIQRSVRQKLRYEVIHPRGRDRDIKKVETVSREQSEWCIDRFKVDDLELKTDYKLRVFDVSEAKEVLIDERTFACLDRNTDHLKFALVSCMKDEHHESQMAIWSTLIEQKPQMIFFIGDTVYADHVEDKSELGIWNKYAETRRLLRIFRADRLIPSIATWDDHDFGINGGDGTYPLKIQTKDIFNAFFGSEEVEGLKHGPGVSKIFEGFGQRFILMDDRSYRAAKYSSGSPWGELQTSWLLEHLTTGDTPVWIMNGGQFFGGYRIKDSFEHAHKQSFNITMKQLAQAKVPFVLASGDVHYSEVMAIEPEMFGFKTFEITSSSIHSSTHMLKDKLAYNKRRLVSAWKHNFVLIESGARANQLRIDLKCISATPQGEPIINFTQSLVIEKQA